MYTSRGRRDPDRMVVGFIATYAISTYRIPIRRGVLDTTLCDIVSDLWHVGGFLRVLRFPPPIKLTVNTEILLKVMLNTLTLTSMHPRLTKVLKVICCT